MENGFSFVKKTGGIASEEQYPYTTATAAGTTGSCVKSKETPVAKYTDGVTGFTDVSTNNEAELKEAVKKQPVSVAVEADKQVHPHTARCIVVCVFVCVTCNTGLPILQVGCRQV